MTTKKQKLKFVGANIPPDLYDKIIARTEVSGRSLSKEILFIIRERLEDAKA